MQHKKSYIHRIFFSFLIFNFSFLISPAQWYDPGKVNQKAGELYGQAVEEASDGKYTEAIKHINEALVIEPKLVDAFLTRSNIYAALKNYPASVSDFKIAWEMDSVYSKIYLLPYSISLAGVGKFQEALDAVNAFLSNPKLNQQSIKAGEYRRSTYEFAVGYEKKHPSKIMSLRRRTWATALILLHWNIFLHSPSTEAK